jgi:3',5'-cyclic AMP phosphodiesterase CpdA
LLFTKTVLDPDIIITPDDVTESFAIAAPQSLTNTLVDPLMIIRDPAASRLTLATPYGIVN